MKIVSLLGLVALVVFATQAPLRDATAGRWGRISERSVFADSTIEPVAGPFEFPWSIAFLSEETLLLTERVGRLQLLRSGLGASPVEGLPPVLYHDHAGLLDVALDPRFNENKTVYLSYVHGTRSLSSLRVLKAKLDQERLLLTDCEVIFDSTPSERTQLFGGRIVVSRSGHLFLTLGDRVKRDHAQNLTNHWGKVIRIHSDGAIPKDNPFISVADVRPEIWTYGHRNPQGLALNEQSADVWSHEHGPLRGDELNLLLPGRNYGWPAVTYGREYSGESIGPTEMDGMEQPIHFWSKTTAPSGLAIEVKSHSTVFWIGALAGQALVRLTMEDRRITREERLENIARIRDVRLSPSGHLYFLSDSSSGVLYRLARSIERSERRGTGKRGL